MPEPTDRLLAPLPALPGWPARYAAILARFGWAAADDHDATRRLAQRVPGHGIDALPRPPSGHATVLGCGPGLATWQPESAATAPFVIAADGATTRCREVSVVPDIVVTDLDGDPGDLRWAAAAGAWMVVHAHGDNRGATQTLVPTLGDRIVATRQSLEPAAGTVNLGGFTDGDRAVLLAEALGIDVTLVGFETDAPPSRYTHRSDPATKAAKLAIAADIIDDVAARGHVAVAGWPPVA